MQGNGLKVITFSSVHSFLVHGLNTTAVSEPKGGADMCECVGLIEPLRCSPPGLPDIISHYPHRSSNSAGAREHGRLPPTLPSFTPSSFVLFFSAALFRFPLGPLQTRLPGGPKGDANVYHPGSGAS